MAETVIKIENLKKKYRLGAIGGGTLTADLQSWWAKKRGKEDPNTKIGDKQYQKNEEFWALKGINLEVKKGEALGIIGANGAGKSTLLKILSRVTAPTKGDIYIKGRITSMLEVGTGFHSEMTGRENIYMNGAILGMSRAEVNKKIDDIIEFSECGKFIDTPVKRYSSGMYVKLAFAVAAHLDSEIMVMDEVLAVGDVKFQQKCLGKMSDAANNEGRTVLYVSHNMSTIRQLCTRCIVLSHGEVIFDGDVEQAISIYAETEKQDNQTIYDLSASERPSLDHGRMVHVEKFEFLQTENAVYTENEKIRARITWKGIGAIEGLRVYFIITCLDGQSVGTAKSEILGNSREGERDFADIEMEFTNLVPGSYYFMIDVMTMNEFGTHCSYDRPNQKIFFEIKNAEEDCSFEWKTRYMGHIEFDDIKTIKASSVV